MSNVTNRKLSLIFESLMHIAKKTLDNDELENLAAALGEINKEYDEKPKVGRPFGSKNKQVEEIN